MKRVRIALLLTLTAMAFTVRGEDSPAIKKELTLLQGEWSMVSGTANGESMPEEFRKQMKRVCKGDEITATMAGQIFLRAKITIDPTKTPKTIDYAMTDGLTKGKTQLGIYEIDGDTLKSCFSAPGAERPTDFSSKAGDERTFSIWKRDKPTTPEPDKKKNP